MTITKARNLAATTLVGTLAFTTTQRYFATTTEAVGEAMRRAMGWKRGTA